MMTESLPLMVNVPLYKAIQGWYYKKSSGWREGVLGLSFSALDPAASVWNAELVQSSRVLQQSLSLIVILHDILVFALTHTFTSWH